MPQDKKKPEKVRKKEEQEALDIDVEKSIKKYPKFMRAKLRLAYKDYQDGNLIIPKGFLEKKKGK